MGRTERVLIGVGVAATLFAAATILRQDARAFAMYGGSARQVSSHSADDLLRRPPPIPYGRLHDWRSRIRPVPIPGASASASAPPMQARSAVHCVGATDSFQSWQHRSCVLSDVCFRPKSESWHFYSGDEGGGDPGVPASATFYDADFGAVPALGFRGVGLASPTLEMQDERFGIQAPLSLNLETGSPPSRLSPGSKEKDKDTGKDTGAVVRVPQPVQLWFPTQHSYYDCNVGHLMWDWSAASSIAAVSQGMRFAVGADSYVRGKSSWNGTRATGGRGQSAGFMRRSSLRQPEGDNGGHRPSTPVTSLLTSEFPRFDVFAEVQGLGGLPCRRVIPAIQPARVATVLKVAAETAGAQYGDGKPVSLLCFDRVLVGGLRNHIVSDPLEAFYSLSNLGREAGLFAYRSAVLTAAGLDPAHVPKRHKIVLLRKKSSFGRAIPRRAIVNLFQAVAWIREAYPSLAREKGAVEVVELEKMPWSKQLELVLSTTLLITPCGGLSTILPFLPVGASAIVMDYPDPGVNRSVSMEGQLWNHFPHVRTMYYQMRDGTDWMWVRPRDASEAPSPDEGVEGALLKEPPPPPEVIETLDPRHDTAPILKKDRILALVRAALSGM
jgi:hypothetical protein